VVGLTVSLPAKWEKFLKQLANDHEIDLNTVVSELCEWAFSDPESKEQFKAWLDEAHPQKEEAEDKAKAAGEEAAEEEEEYEEESEKETQDRTE
jgi:metal-dependent amidase/aminoacylase/carboxypeptidase family protein